MNQDRLTSRHSLAVDVCRSSRPSMHCWAEAPIKIARMTLTIKLDRNWSSFQLANSAPPLSVTDSAPSARMVATVSNLPRGSRVKQVVCSGVACQAQPCLQPACHGFIRLPPACLQPASSLPVTVLFAWLQPASSLPPACLAWQTFYLRRWDTSILRLPRDGYERSR